MLLFLNVYCLQDTTEVFFLPYTIVSRLSIIIGGREEGYQMLVIYIPA